MNASTRKGFSLMELLAVIAVIAILAGLALPSVTQTLRATKLTTSGQKLADELNLARQTAISRNAPVEVRFYKLPDHDAPVSSAPTTYRALQSFLIQSGTATPLEKPVYFQVPVQISTNISESPFFSSTNHPEETPPTGVTLPDYGNTYRYRSFRFAPGGSAGIRHSENFFTLVLQNDPDLTKGANFFTIQVNPINGGVRSFRP